VLYSYYEQKIVLLLCVTIDIHQGLVGIITNDSEELIHVRIGSDVKKRIQELVDRGDYKDITSFVKEAILERLDPFWDLQKIKRSILHLRNTDPEFRKLMNLKE
jgi:Arc/MetJ-type ribon-helix-helix transcriptional regulator